MSLSHPTEPSEISDEWLTSLLRGVGAIAVCKVRSFELVPLIPGSPGMAVAELNLAYDLLEAGSPAKLMVVSADPDAGKRSQYHQSGHYSRMVQVLNDDADSGVRHCLCAHLDPRTGATLIVLEPPSMDHVRSRAARALGRERQGRLVSFSSRAQLDER